MKTKKIKRMILATLVSALVTSSCVTSATTFRTSIFNTAINSYQETGNVLKVDMDETGQVTYSTTNSSLSSNAQEETKFSWDNATVYFALTDRFNNGDTSNDYSYGRG